jgi:hypothetical protein
MIDSKVTLYVFVAGAAVVAFMFAYHLLRIVWT